MIVETKKCDYCNKEFICHSKLRKYCSSRCADTKHYQKHKRDYIRNSKNWQINNKDKQREIAKKSAKKFCINNRGKLNLLSKRYYIKNKEKVKTLMRRCYKENPEKFKAKNIKYRKENPGKIKAYNNRPKVNLVRRLRTRLGHALRAYTVKGKVKSSDEYGINYEEIIEHLRPFPEDRHLYHIDHIRPLCSFNFINEDGTQNVEEIRKAFAPENHQWLLAPENISKGGRLMENQKKDFGNLLL